MDVTDHQRKKSLQRAAQDRNGQARNLHVSVKEPANLEARYWLMYASALRGISFDIGLLHITHSLEHTLSALKPDVAHGSGLIAILPAIAKQIYPALPEALADLYRPIIPDLRGSPDEAYHTAKKSGSSA
jgi:alcohol dehydrogenase class IV